MSEQVAVQGQEKRRKVGWQVAIQGQEKRRTTTVWLQRPQIEAGRWPSKAKRNDESGGPASGRLRPRRSTNGVEREVEGFLFFSGHGRHVIISLATRHRQAGTRQGLACWREFEYLEKAKDRKPEPRRAMQPELERTCARIVATHRTRSARVQSSRGSRRGRVQS